MKKFKFILVKCGSLERTEIPYIYTMTSPKNSTGDLDADVELARAIGEARYGRNGYFVGAERV